MLIISNMNIDFMQPRKLHKKPANGRASPGDGLATPAL